MILFIPINYFSICFYPVTLENQKHTSVCLKATHFPILNTSSTLDFILKHFRFKSMMTDLRFRLYEPLFPSTGYIPSLRLLFYDSFTKYERFQLHSSAYSTLNSNKKEEKNLHGMNDGSKKGMKNVKHRIVSTCCLLLACLTLCSLQWSHGCVSQEIRWKSNEEEKKRRFGRRILVDIC